jgi:hypothetical protein
MTEPSDPDIEVAIRVLRRDILEGGRNVDWEAIRARIRRLLIARRPSPDERITLLELYGQLVSRVERLRALNADSLRRVCNQRAADTVGFALAEAREHGGLPFGVIIDRELAAGRLRVDRYFINFVSQILDAVDPGGHGAPGFDEEAAPFSFPPELSRPPASSSFPPGP